MTDTTSKPLHGRVALVTGGGRGIGRSTAWALAERGASVAVLARSSERVAAVTAELTQSGHRALGLTADVTDSAGLAAAIAQAVSTLGPIDILINNAAILGPLESAATGDPELWVRTQEINLIGAYRCLRLVLPGMLTRGWGRIVNVTSGAANGRGIPHSSAYSVSKAALDMLTRAVAAEVAGSGICVNGVSPGVVDTEMQALLRDAPPEQFGPESSERFRGLYARGELQAPDRPARLIAGVVLSGLNGEIVGIREDRAQTLIDSAA